MKSKLILSTVAIAAVLIIAYILYSGSPMSGKGISGSQANWDTNKPAKPDLPEFAPENDSCGGGIHFCSAESGQA